MDKRYGILIVSVTIFVLCFVGTASATNWSVDGSGGADFTGIQEAINNAKDGDTLMVHSGVYYENVVVNKSITLKGIGHPIVDANGSGSAITLTADGITLEGFTVANSGKMSQYDAGINVNSNNNNITSNNVSSNNWRGIHLSSSCSNTITSNTARNNFVGIYLNESCNNNITGNNVSNNYDGIDLFFSSNNNIAGNNVRSNEYGIPLYFSSNNNTITGNNVSNNFSGIQLYESSSNNTITGNVFVNDGLSVHSSYQNTVENNTVTGKPLVYLEDASDYRVEDAGQVILVNCNNITVENLDLSNTSVGVEVLETENCIISKNTVSRIFLDYSRNNTIRGNNVSSNNYYDDGIFLGYSSNNTITGNSVCNNYRGIHLVFSCNNNILSNNVSNNAWSGILLVFSSNNNTLTGNNVSNNYYVGIGLGDSCNNTLTGNTVSNNYPKGYSSGSDNLIYLNNFINNTDNVDSSYESPNIWNSTEKITYIYNGTTYTNYLGNYWDDYEGTDADGDGIGDTHYRIVSEKDDSDDYPLMKPFENYILPRSAPI